MKHISDSLWCEIEKLIQQKETAVGRPEFDNKKTFEGIVFVLKTGIQWQLLPEKYGCYTTIHGKYMKWARDGVFRKMLIKAREYYRRRNNRNNCMLLILFQRKLHMLSSVETIQLTEQKGESNTQYWLIEKVRQST